MATLSKYIQAQKFSLAVGISTTDTSITLQSFNFPDGTAIASGDLSATNYGTLEPGTSREEQISFTGITANGDSTVTLTGVTRGLGFGAVDTYSEQTDLKVQHGAGATFIISNTAAFYDTFVNKKNDEEITGTLTVPTPTLSGHAVTKAYADALVTAGLDQNKVVVAGTAGESVAAGDLVYFNDTDNEWKKTDANLVATIDNVIIGIAQGTGSDGGAITDGVLIKGVDETQTGMTVGVKLYASDTAGEISESAGSNSKVIGFSFASTGLYLDTTFGELPSSGEKAALSGVNNAPSTTNPFVTTDDLSDPTVKPPQVVTFTSSGTWTKDAGLKYVVVEVQGGGANGSEQTGGAGGGYSKKLILSSALGATETVTVGSVGGNSSFGSHCSGSGASGVTPGVGTGGDLNITGGRVGALPSGNNGNDGGPAGGNSMLGIGGPSAGFQDAGIGATGYGAGGGASGEGSINGGEGTAGIVIVTEYYV